MASVDWNNFVVVEIISFSDEPSEARKDEAPKKEAKAIPAITRPQPRPQPQPQPQLPQPQSQPNQQVFYIALTIFFWVAFLNESCFVCVCVSLLVCLFVHLLVNAPHTAFAKAGRWYGHGHGYGNRRAASAFGDAKQRERRKKAFETASERHAVHHLSDLQAVHPCERVLGARPSWTLERENGTWLLLITITIPFLRKIFNKMSVQYSKTSDISHHMHICIKRLVYSYL